jgi:KipI family sensor histidine kinase inhibitor
MGVKVRFHRISPEVLSIELEGTSAAELSYVAEQLESRFSSIQDVVFLNGVITVFSTELNLILDELVSFFDSMGETFESSFRTWYIPIWYNGLDLQFIAEKKGMSIDRIKEIHQKEECTTVGYGFLPGFFYASGVPESLDLPRRSSPRARVPAQSVAFAAAQIAIYPFETSGGWNILGTTPYQFFDPNKNPPVIVKAGDRLRFYEIDESHFKALQLIWETSSDREKLLSHVC